MPLHKACPYCDQTGVVTCPECHGSGSVLSRYFPHINGQITCPVCSGSGLVTCRICEGRRAIEIAEY